MQEDEDVINEEQEPDIEQQNESKDDGEDVNYDSASSESDKTLKKLHKSIKVAGKANPVWNGGDKYHVTMSEGGHEVNPQEELGQEGEDGVLKWEPKKPKCSYCNEEGHNSRTCISKKTDQETNKRQRDAEDAAAFKEKLTKLQKSQTDMCAQKSAAKSPLKKTKTVNHGGVVKPFKAPAQAGPSGVEYFETNAQNVTTLKQLQSVIRKKKSNMKKKF
ncbi:hypothetical protein POM88_019449 [Heracleum sosnowskyi]|uniref:CCHC-type domain-containing protein n=1 Tax=Heracleum sosnowskyi TaxID=360622 RepID=A0AAD8I9P7_9APIA|nr:hypothetical protein POM88_019449 [Heracleum sosnowskyi]